VILALDFGCGTYSEAGVGALGRAAGVFSYRGRRSRGAVHFFLTSSCISLPQAIPGEPVTARIRTRANSLSSARNMTWRMDECLHRKNLKWFARAAARRAE
jgi:hypothetical protein